MEMRVYLKICEGCGCLWYRAQQDVRVYCVGCYERLKEFPTTQSRKRRGRPRKLTLPTVLAVQEDSLEPMPTGEFELPEAMYCLPASALSLAASRFMAGAQ